MKTAAQRLEAFGTALFGPSWHGPLSRALDVSDRTLRRWMSGEFEMPEGIWAECKALCEETAKRLAKLAKDG